MAGTLLELVRDGRVTRVVPVGDGPISVGADLANGFVVDDPAVSAFHLVLTPGPAGLVAVDLGSTNGTRVNGAPALGPTPLGVGDEVALGPAVTLRVRAIVRRDATYAVKDVDSGMLHPVEPPGAAIGAAPTCGVPLPPGGPDEAGWILLLDGEVWLSTDDDERELAAGQAFSVAGQRFELVERGRATRSTLYDRTDARPYRLHTRLDGPGGPRARVVDGATGQHHTVAAETRATLLHVLARRRHDDLAADTPEPLAGWMDDEDVAVAVWGRAAWSQSSSQFSVLVHRVRQELRSAGFDPWFLEKRRGAIRVAIAVGDEA